MLGEACGSCSVQATMTGGDATVELGALVSVEISGIPE